MEKLQMCRICLVENVRMYLVVNRTIFELYKRLTNISFVTDDKRPNLVCYFCYAKLKATYQLITQCLVADELFTRLLIRDYERNPSISHDQLIICGGLVICETEITSNVVETVSITKKEEIPAVSEIVDDDKQPEEEHLSDGATVAQELNQDQNQKRRKKPEDATTARPTDKDKSDSTVIWRTPKGATVAKKSKQVTQQRTTKQKDAITADQKKKGKTKSIIKLLTRKRMSKPDTKFKEKCDQKIFNAVKQNKPSVEKPKKCDVCERSFSRPALLTIHKRTHTHEKPFKCDVCQRSFSDKGNLTRHNRLHTGEKPYECQICERRFRNNDTLKKHFRIHLGVKPYTCDVCQRSFREAGNLTKHLRIHSGEKPYKCSICKHGFSEKSNLTKHISKMHQTIERKNVYPIQTRSRQKK